MAAGKVALTDPEDFPPLYRAADRVSLDGQQRYFRALRVRLGALLVAAAGGLVWWTEWELHVGGLIAVLGFAVALATDLYSALTRPDRRWYQGRAAAESAKTLTWKYVVRGRPFPGPALDPATDTAFLNGVREVIKDLSSVALSVQQDSVGAQITPAMRAVRGLGLEERRGLYVEGRLRDQLRWYSDKARWNERRGSYWLLAGIAFQLVGLLLAAWRAFGDLELNLAGLAAAGAATVAAWVQAKQYGNLSTAYSVTAHELAAVAAEAVHVADEATWAAFVDQAEEAISREHTLWRASRGLSIAPRRGGQPT